MGWESSGRRCGIHGDSSDRPPLGAHWRARVQASTRRSEQSPSRRNHMIERVCIVGAGTIGSLFAGHLAQVADVHVLTRRKEHADALNERGLRVTGRAELVARMTATADAIDIPDVDLMILACKG